MISWHIRWILITVLIFGCYDELDGESTYENIETTSFLIKHNFFEIRHHFIQGIFFSQPAKPNTVINDFAI
jgi:hypothetical protein